MGKEYDAVFCGVPIHIKIVADATVEKEFGTGALGVTPAHSQIDADIATRHKLETKQVINEYAKMTVGDERLMGKKTTEAREIIAQWLRDEGLMEKEEDITQNVSTAERTGAVIEPLPKLQWFIDVNKSIATRDNKSLKELMLEPVKNGAIKIMPDQFESVYFHWIENLRDWCISRQIWYGHRIPVWYKENEIYCGVEAPQDNTNFVFLHGKYKTRDIIDPLNWLSQKLSRKNNFWQILPEADIDTSKEAQMKFVLENAQIDENTVIVAHSRGGKLAMKFLEETGKVIKGLVLISTGVGERKVPPTSGKGSIESYSSFDFEKIKSCVKEGIVVFEATTDHLYGPEAFTGFAKDLGAKHIKAEKSESHYNQVEAPEILEELKKFTWSQDEDTLDTWFSSGLWTFSTLGWPEETADLTAYHPTTVLETGRDIIFFWVARMILMSQYLLGEVPFKTVYLHGLVRDEKGRKMSKSLGNIIDPLTLIDKYGTDALRMAMIVGVGPGSDSNLGEEKIKAYSKFANKLWNITRFVLENTKTFDGTINILDTEDAESFREFEAFLEEITKEMHEYKFYLVAEKLYHYSWHTFADIIIERSKQKIIASESSGTVASADSARTLLALIFPKLITTLHPFMPFVTEEIWSFMPNTKGRMLMVEKWPCKQ